EGTWTDRLGQLLRDPAWQAVWDAHAGACQQIITELGRRTTFLARRRIEVPEDRAAAPRQLVAQLAEARAPLADGKESGRTRQGALLRAERGRHRRGREPARGGRRGLGPRADRAPPVGAPVGGARGGVDPPPRLPDPARYRT